MNPRRTPCHLSRLPYLVALFRGLTAWLALLSLAAMFGCHPQSPSALTVGRPTGVPPGLFQDRADTAGIHARLGHKSLAHLNILDTIGHGCAFLDYDGDGKLDILLVQDTQCRLYRNLGNGKFDEVTAQAFPNTSMRAGLIGCAVGDYDEDGRPDIFLTGYGRTILYHNQGNGTFLDVTVRSGLEARNPYDWTTSAAWADVDGDGHLDLYVCRYVRFTPQSRPLCPYPSLDGSETDMACGPTSYISEQGSLYRGDGKGHFKDITKAAGLSDTHGDGLGCMFCDFNGDGRPDLYVANDQKPGDLYLNLGGGHFKNVGVESGTATGADGAMISGMGMDWGDYDNDGRFDLLMANFAAQPKSLFHNEDGKRFADCSYVSGLGAASLASLSFGAAFIDTANSGRLDIVLTNGHVRSQVEKTDRNASYRQSTQLFLNQGDGHQGNGRFVDASRQAGADFTRPIVGRGIAVGDYDGDGKMDLLIVDDEGAPLLLHNEAKEPNHWLALRCVAGSHKREIIGAQVRILTGARTQIAEDRTTGSYLSSNAPGVHFGLGQASKVEMLEIRWPGGRKSVFHNVAADHNYLVSPDGLRPAP